MPRLAFQEDADLRHAHARRLLRLAGGERRARRGRRPGWPPRSWAARVGTMTSSHTSGAKPSAVESAPSSTTLPALAVPASRASCGGRDERRARATPAARARPAGMDALPVATGKGLMASSATSRRPPSLEERQVAQRLGGLEGHHHVRAAGVGHHGAHLVAEAHDRRHGAATLGHAMDLRHLDDASCRHARRAPAGRPPAPCPVRRRRTEGPWSRYSCAPPFFRLQVRQSQRGFPRCPRSRWRSAACFGTQASSTERDRVLGKPQRRQFRRSSERWDLKWLRKRSTGRIGRSRCTGRRRWTRARSRGPSRWPGSPASCTRRRPCRRRRPHKAPRARGPAARTGGGTPAR